MPDPAAVGSWLQIFFYIAGSVAALIVAWKKWVEPGRPELLSVTRAELGAVQLQFAGYASKEEVSRLESAMKNLEVYTHTQMHDIRGELHPIRLSLARIDIVVRLLAKNKGIPLPDDAEG